MKQLTSEEMLMICHNLECKLKNKMFYFKDFYAVDTKKRRNGHLHSLLIAA